MTRSIGTTSLQVTTLGFGGGPIGRSRDPSYSEHAAALVDAAWDGGIRYFDVAPLYGRGLSEQRLGTQLQRRPRDEYVLSTKVGRLLVPDSSRELTNVDYDYSYDGARRSLDASLKRLGLARIDILLCHDIDVWTHGDQQPDIYDTASNGILKAMVELKEQGVVDAIGLGVNESDVCIDVMKSFPVDCFLLAGRFTLLEQAPLDDFLPQCVEHGVSVIIGGPYNSGMLAVTERERATYDYQPVDDQRWQRAGEIRRVCDAHGVDTRAAALQYPLRHPAVASVIPGVWKVEEVQTNLKLARAPIPDALWDDLDAEGLTRKI